MLTKAFIPFKGYYSSPFSRWQGSMANENSISLGANTSRRWLESKSWDPKIFNYLILGMTVSQLHQFYSSTWAAALMGATDISAVFLSQACTTSTTCIYQAAMGVETGLYENCYTLMTDRCSNGPHTVWPNPMGPGGEVISENWLMDNFNGDPNVGLKMIETAENVAKEGGFTKEQCDDLALKRYEQYLMSLENDREFQKRYMFPADGGVLSFGSQTHPADGNCGVIVTTKEKADELSADKTIKIQIVSYGYARVKKGYMAAAPVPAANMALENAGLKIQDIKTVKTHNPFAVNDLYMAKEMGIDPNGTDAQSFNNFRRDLRQAA